MFILPKKVTTYIIFKLITIIQREKIDECMVLKKHSTFFEERVWLAKTLWRKGLYD